MSEVCCEVGSKSCGCPVTGHQAACPVTGTGSCGCPVTGKTAGGPGECCDSFANAADVWTKEMVEAIRQVKLEVLREKVRKELGPQFIKAAEATWQTGGAFFRMMLVQAEAAEAKDKLREEIRKIFSEKK